MGLFGESNNSFLGIDIGSSSIKVVELKKKKDKVALVTYGFSDRLAENYTDINKLDIKAITSTIESIVRKAGFSSSHNVVSSLPTYTVFSSIINLSGNLNPKDLESAIQWEAKKVVPLPLKDIYLGWQKISGEGLQKKTSFWSDNLSKMKLTKETAPTTQVSAANKAKSTNKILLIGAPKNLIKSYAYTFKTLKFNLVSLETEVFGLIRSLVGNDKATSMIVQIGANSTNIFIVDKGVPVLSRSIDVGGLSITKAISRNLNISLEKAEQFKYDLAASSQGLAMPKMLSDIVAPIFNEVKYVMEVFASKEGYVVEKIILTGGSAMLHGLPDYLANMLNVNVVIGDPWFRIAYPVEIKPVLEQIGPRLAVAIGLAMSEFDKENT
jgi:type IV pilus assembly protein PilM